MDTQRLILFIALSLVLLLLWQRWQETYAPTPETATAPAETPGDITTSEAPSAEGGSPAAPPPAPGTSDGVASPPADSAHLLPRAQRIHVFTDVYDLEIDTYGGDIRYVALKDYPVDPDQPQQPFVLMNDTLPNIFIAQSGLTASTGAAPGRGAVYNVDQTEYRLADNADELEVPLTWNGPNDLYVTKTYMFHRGSYVIDVVHEVTNGSGETWRGGQYRELQRTQVAEFGQSPFIHTYMGAVFYTEEEGYEKIDFSTIAEEKLNIDSRNGWIAILQHYFFGAWIPQSDQLNRYYTRYLPQGVRYVIGLISQEKAVAAGDSAEFSSRLYVGPKLQDVLADVAPGLELTVDYGILTVLSQPLFWLLETLHDLVGNWGWAIVLVTLLIKLAFYKLSETSYKSMANMRRLQPRLQAMKERYGNDKQKLNQALMDLYKKEKINPLGGCLPILVQIPVFIALYWVLLESVELRQAPFVLWINDLSAPDPYYILPLIMGVTMFLQQRLNPAPLDPIQQKVMMVLPVVFTIFFAFFPAGLVLYWVANNALSIAQQWVITRRIEQAPSKS